MFVYRRVTSQKNRAEAEGDLVRFSVEQSNNVQFFGMIEGTQGTQLLLCITSNMRMNQ